MTFTRGSEKLHPWFFTPTTGDSVCRKTENPPFIGLDEGRGRTTLAFLRVAEFVRFPADIDLRGFTYIDAATTLFHCHQQLHMDYGFMSLFAYDA